MRPLCCFLKGTAFKTHRTIKGKVQLPEEPQSQPQLLLHNEITTTSNIQHPTRNLQGRSGDINKLSQLTKIQNVAKSPSCRSLVLSAYTPTSQYHAPVKQHKFIEDYKVPRYRDKTLKTTPRPPKRKHYKITYPASLSFDMTEASKPDDVLHRRTHRNSVSHYIPQSGEIDPSGDNNTSEADHILKPRLLQGATQSQQKNVDKGSHLKPAEHLLMCKPIAVQEHVQTELRA